MYIYCSGNGLILNTVTYDNSRSNPRNQQLRGTVVSSMWRAALTPRPRDAKVLQSVQKFAPLYLFVSAWIHASRASVTSGRGG